MRASRANRARTDEEAVWGSPPIASAGAGSAAAAPAPAAPQPRWTPTLSDRHAASLLALALAPTPAAARVLIDALPASDASALATALGVAAARCKLPRSARAALATAASWALQYRTLRSKHAPRIARAWADAVPRKRAGVFRVAFAAAAHLIQEEAGSAVLVSPEALLTCAHCVSAEDDPDDGSSSGEEEEEEETAPPARVGRVKLALLADGTVLVAECAAVDEAADLALLCVRARSSMEVSASWVSPAAAPPRDRAPLICIGNPSEFDLESGGRSQFMPPVFFTSQGVYRGLTEPARRAAIGLGGMRHNCWTYWGHSGAPLLDGEGALCGLHNSLDPRNAARHGVALGDIQRFLAPFQLPQPPAPRMDSGRQVAAATQVGAREKRRRE